MTLTAKTIRSAGIVTLSGYFQLIISFVGNIILTRLLTPEDFGVFSLALSILMLLYMFSGFGVQESIIQYRGSFNNTVIPTAFWLTIAMALSLAVLGTLLGIILSSFYSSTIVYILIALSWIRMGVILRAAYAAVLKRDLNYRPIALNSIATTLLSFVAGILAALLGVGVWSLLVREAVAAATGLVGLRWASGYKLENRFDRQAAKWIWDFGWRAMIARISEVLFGQADNFFVGTFQGTVNLGYYSLAYRQAYLIHQVAQGAMNTVIFSAFSEIQDSSKKLSYGFNKLNFWLWRVAIPLGLLFGLLGDKLVTWVYGDKWNMAGELFQNMFIFSMLLPVDIALKNLLVGAGHVNGVMHIRVVQLVFFIPLVVGSAYWLNVFAVAWIVNASLILSCLLMLRHANGFIDIDWKYLFNAPLIAVAGALISFICLNSFLSNINFDGAPIILISVVTLFAYIGILILVDHSALAVEIGILRMKLRKPNAQT